ncbi:Pycsar system effector family protein [Actinoplanes solisilvae]|uniref:Pycsar system effector family protein n=1 Tax=Actinoplanes solisilvae TaxID=2486853 RepID=UPI000FDC146C|nr:Pycsar system effector family protein [Actinoplanes solisilvae]
MTIHNYEINTAADSTAQPMADVQAQIARVDTKASILFGFALAALTGGTVIVSKAHLHGPSAVSAAIAADMLCVALVLLGLAIRPNLNGNHGFLRWAAAPDASKLHTDLHAVSDVQERVAHLYAMARSARTKYQRVRLAVDSLGVALAFALLTAILANLGR